MRHFTITKFIILFLSSFLFGSSAFAQVTTQTFNCTGAAQTFVVPGCVTSITVEAWGGGGGGGGIDSYAGSNGGGGAYATSTIAVTPGQVLTVIVGCGGTQGGACAGSGPGGPGGFGLGNGGVGGNSGGSGCSGPGGGGGGGTGLQNGGTILLVAGGGGGGGGGGNNGGGTAGGGGGQDGSPTTSAPAGLIGASGSTVGLAGASTSGDGAGGGGGGGGLVGGGGGGVPGTDYGGSGGAGGTSQGTTIVIGNSQLPGNSGSANLCAGCATGGNGGAATPGGAGEMVISYTTPTTITGTITNSAGACGIATATVAPSGGSPGYTYTWSPTGGNAAASTNLTNGSYTVTITDANGCTGTATTSIALPPALTLTASHTNVICNGLTNGSATATATGGTGPYTYGWSPGPPQFSITGIATGLSGGTTYTVGVQDAAGCQDTLSMTITQPAILQQTLTATSPICTGSSSVLTDAVAGGTAPYTVSWSSGGSNVGALVTTTVSPIGTTSYTASVLDANSCANTATVTVTVNSLPNVTVTSATICAGSSATLTAAGANTYGWAPGGGLSATAGTSVTANPAITTVYTITGTDINNCVKTATSTVTVNSLPTITAASATICAGSSTTLTAGGANTYTWSPGAGLSATTGNSVTANPVITTPYTITGTDLNNCVSTTTSTVTVNPLPTVTVNSATICLGQQTATLTAGGANTYAWASGTGLSATVGTTVTATPVTTTVYTITGTDVNNCVKTATSTVTVNSLPTAVASSNAPLCIGQTLNLSSSGGATYGWAGPNGFLSATQNPNIAAVTALATGTYSVLVTDANNCYATATTGVTINNPPIVSVASATICAGSSTTLTATGATTYTWFPGTGLGSTSGGTVTANPLTTTNYTITGNNGCTSTTTATVTVNSLPIVTVNSATVCPTFSGTLTAVGALTYSWNTGATTPSVTISPNATTFYTVTGTDANTCSSSATATITVNPALVLTIGGTTPICQGATLNLTSTPGVVWAWLGPPAYSSNSQNPTILNAQPNMSGTYSVAAQDANGCADTAFINITVNPLPLPVASNNSAICANQALNFTGAGAGIGGTYIWTGPNSYSVSIQNPSIANAPVNVSGIYTLTVTDSKNCVNKDTTLVIVNPLPVVTVNSATICIGNSAILTATDATAGGTYTWTPAANLSAGTGSPVTATPTTTSSYSVTETYPTGCATTISCSVVVNLLPIVTVNSGTICAGKNTTLQALGANTFSWTPANGLSSNSGSTVIASPASSATYIVTGTDANNCANTATCTVHVNPLPNLIASPQTTSGCEPLCVAFSNVGTSNGTYFWNFGDGKTNNTSAPTHCYSKGTFSVSVQLVDSNGCVNTSAANVIAFPKPQANFYATPQPTTILDPLVHFVDGTAGGAIITTWNWNFGDNHGISVTQNPSYNYLDTGTFAVQLAVISDLGCKDSIIINVTINDEYLIYVPNAFSPNYDGTNDVFMPRAEGVTEYKLYVYDRWGKLVFYSTDLYQGWDGRRLNTGNDIAQEDIYVWKIEAKNKKGEPKLLKGVVSLLK